ncbi:acyl-CoA dehydrogenase family protein [Phytohabitans houttuyneae]|uniref:Acyl-CoA dehydrogenase n=1 Tax=Phytohabitans houttuyneae TaxID=1076126 RepID=A0A6V8KG55_9ACTN|nr:acyl-CoA dehydrogenase family protein [Phytohabitans houttuyneae]GFJ82360.1 acyl-CoA dehydrogenase [Phytohabitans houttuyneae]
MTLDEADRAALRELAGTLAAALATPARVRAAMDAGGRPDRELDAELASTGLWGLEAPEEYGGGGASFHELATVLQELGARAAPSRLTTSAVLCAGAVLLGGTAAQRERWLPALAAGQAYGTAALTEWCATTPPTGRVQAERHGSGWVLRGAAAHVLDARVSDLLVVPAVAGPDSLVAVVPSRAGGVATRPVAMTDGTRCADHVTLDGVSVPDADVLAVGSDADRLIAALVNRAAAAIAADSAGNAQRVLAMTVGYAGERQQFGRPIGSFQAVKHQAADMLVNAETAAALLDAAVREAAAEPAECEVAVSMAKEYGCERAAANAGTALQLHGGIGYTWEHDLHIYLKRAKLNEFLFGDGRWHRARVARSLVRRAGPPAGLSSSGPGERNNGASAITTR